MAKSRWNSFIQFLCEVYQTPMNGRQGLVDELLNTQDEWPWVERDRATFVYDSWTAQNVALNIDIVNRDPPFESMARLEETSLWYFQRYFERDALGGLHVRHRRSGHAAGAGSRLDGARGQVLASGPAEHALSISARQVNTSVLQMPRARPFPNWQAMAAVPRGRVYRHRFSSVANRTSAERSLWVYTPPGYDANDGKRLPPARC